MVIIVSIMPYSSSEMMPRFTNSRAIAMAILYWRSWRVCCSSIAVHLLSSKGITVPGAILPSCFPITLKDSATILAHDPIISLFIQSGLVVLPPSHTAFVRAIPLNLFVWSLYKWSSAMAAQPFVIGNIRLRHWVSITMNLNCILRNTGAL